jgi:hypothetical protein
MRDLCSSPMSLILAHILIRIKQSAYSNVQLPTVQFFLKLLPISIVIIIEVVFEKN